MTHKSTSWKVLETVMSHLNSRAERPSLMANGFKRRATAVLKSKGQFYL